VGLSPGTRLASYEIVGPLGAGGMGEVYRARDTRLKRDVAIKMLSDAYSTDAERLARFEREAQTLAALNHPHIAHIYGLETAGPESASQQHALVMELVEGADLSQRLAAGPIPIDDALPMARQIADALEAAHEHGIIHRDLKPSNIKVRPDGTVKVLDFGLAKLTAPAKAGALTAGSPRSSNEGLGFSQAETSPAVTVQGVILGTAAYMSPEQARGGVVDRRADIWAFGCVLYEMLTAQRAFDGDTVSDILASVLRKEIDWSRLPLDTPPAIRQLLRRCLTRDARVRLRDVGDARLVIDEMISPTPAVAAEARNWSESRRIVWLRRGLIAAALTALAAGALAAWSMTRVQPQSVIPIHASIAVGDGVTMSSESIPALSPDGTMLVFSGRAGDKKPWQLYLRRLDQPQAKAMPGTEDAVDPFFSPDGRFVGFFAGQKLRTVPTSGGVVTTLADATGSRGGWWAPDDFIFFTPAGERGIVVFKVPAGGGPTQPVTTLRDKEVTNRWPQVLPAGKGVLYTAHSQTGTYDSANLVVSSLSGDRREIVLRGGYYGRYLSSGHLAYIHKQTLFVVPFDLDRLEVTGPAVPFIEDVTADPTSGVALYASSDTGALVYSQGPGRNANVTIAWIDEKGIERPMRTVPGDYANVRFSPDGRYLAMDVGADWGEVAIHTYDWARDVMTNLTTGNDEDQWPVWSPDGRRIAFAGQRDGAVVENLYWQRADGSDRATRLVTSPVRQIPSSWHPGGTLLAFETAEPGLFLADIGIVSVDESQARAPSVGAPQLLLSEKYVEGFPAFSPDGRWLAYMSIESGKPEVYVRPFPSLESRTKISTDDGTNPIWSPVKAELFYASRDGSIWAVPYRATPDAFVVEKARQWAPPGTVLPRGGSFDLHPDGKRFAILKGVPPPERQHVSLMLDAFTNIRQVLQAAMK
jgi:serine/threonine protein kinase/Tol biopolymer transport system component